MTAFSLREAQIHTNYREVLDEVAEAARASGRRPEAVCVIGVTKYVGVEEAAALHRAGCRQLAESRPQQLWDKAEQLPGDVRWHLIGHLQRNKVKKTLEYTSLIHSLDSLRLLEQLAHDAASSGRACAALLEVHIATDATKTGIRPDDAASLLREYAEREDWRRWVSLQGLMGMSSLGASSDQQRREFAALRSLVEGWNRAYDLELRELSMGMSDDFAIAIEEGSTMVRIGSRLFQGDTSASCEVPA